MSQTEIEFERKPLSKVAKLSVLLLSIASNVALANFSQGKTRRNAIELNLLVYNTHGLPTVFARDNPQERFQKNGALIEKFDLSLLQEDFAHHESLKPYVNGAARVEGGEDKENPKCVVCSGSGLTFVSNLPPEHWFTRTTFEPFEKCSGWFSRANHCFVQKGFQLIELSGVKGHRFYCEHSSRCREPSAGSCR